MTKFADVSSDVFVERLVNATVQAAFHGGRPFLLGFQPLTEGGVKAALVDSAGSIRTIIKGIAPAWLDGNWVGKVDAECALAVIGGYLDHRASDLWRSIVAGNALGADETDFLSRWTKSRVPCGHTMPAEEAQRLFGDAPMVTEVNTAYVGTDLRIDWEGPERVLGPDPRYMRCKENAQMAFSHAVKEAEERFIGACYAAYLPLWLHRAS
jgi:hypothetical protein